MKAKDVADTMKKARKAKRKAGRCSAKLKRAVAKIEEKGGVDNPYAVARAAVGK